MKLATKGFLVAAAAAVLIHGFDRRVWAIDEGGCYAPEKTPPAWLLDAFAEMRDTASPGIAIVLPADDAARKSLRAEIEALLKNPTDAAKTLLVEAVYVVADAEHVGANPGETVVLLGADGKRVSGSSAKLTNAAFAEIVRPLLRADDRLAKRAKTARTARVEKLLAELDGDDAEKAEAAVAALVAEFASAGPAVIASHEALPAEGERKALRARVLDGAFRVRRGGDMSGPGRPLPFGTKWTSPKEPEVDPCPACGMMMRADRARDVLELLAKPPAPAK